MMRFYPKALVSLLLVSSGLARAQDLLTPDNEYIMELRFTDGLILSDSNIFLQKDNVWYLPLGETSDQLGALINFSSKLLSAEGYIFSPANKLKLDAKKCVYWMNVDQKKYDCRNIFSYDGDLYMESNLFEKIFESEVTIDPYKSRAEIKSEKTFPVQEKLMREKRAAQIQKRRNQAEARYPVRGSPSSLIDGPYVDLSFQTNWRKDGSETSHGVDYSSIASGELLYMDTNNLISGDEEGVDAFHLTFSRTDEKGEDLWSFGKLRHFEAWDVALPSLTLLGGGGFGRGAFLTSFSRSSASNFSNHRIEGNLAEGWELELYQDSLLIERKLGDKTGRFAFADLLLTQGENQFTLKFYGPHGQSREEYKDIWVDPSVQKTNSLDWRLGYVSREDRINEARDPRYMAELQYGLFSNLSMYSATSGFNPDFRDAPRHYYLGGAKWGFGRNFITADYSKEFTEGGDIFQVGWKSKFMRWLDYSISYAQGNRFVSEDVDKNGSAFLENRYSFSTNFVIPLFLTWRNRLSYERDSFDDDSLSDELKYILSTQIRRLFIQNQLSFSSPILTDYAGKILAIYSLRENQFRYEMSHTNFDFHTYAASWRKKIQKTYWLRTGLSYETGASNLEWSFNFDRQFKYFKAFLTTSTNFALEHYIGVGANVSINRDTQSAFDSVYHFYGENTASYGGVVVMAFQDLNFNGKYDQGDRKLEDISFLINGQASGPVTDKEGVTYISHFPSHVRSLLSLSYRSLGTRILKPVEEVFEVYGRPGKTHYIEFPLVNLVDLAGNVFEVSKVERGRGQLEVELYNSKKEKINSMKSEFDGFFMFSDLRPGNYFVRITPESSKRFSLINRGEYRPVFLSPDFEENEDLYIRFQRR